MVPYYGDFAEDDTVLIPFNTFSSDDPAASVTITNLADADLKVHKDGSVTQIVTDGATITIDFDGITGNHLITIDTSAHADYSTGSEYAVRMEGTTVDGATINAWVGAFSIERAGGVLALLKGTNSLANIEDKIDIIDTNVDQIETAVITNATGADIAADIIAMKAETVLIVGDTAELQGDWVDGGRLDLLLDAIPTTAMRGTDSAALASVCTEARLAELAAANLPSDIDAILADTGTDGVLLTSAYDFAKGTVAMTEAYAANAAAPTPVQALFAIHQMLQQFGISGTTYTVRKLDDTATAFVVTLDDATSPTDAKRV